MADIPVEYYNQHLAAPEIKAKWWTCDKDVMHRHVFGVLRRIRASQNYRSVQNLRFARLYSNMEIQSLSSGLYARAQDTVGMVQNRVTYNAIKSCTDTVAAKIAKNKVKPFFLTDGGSWDMQRRAMRTNQFIEGLFDSMGTGNGDNRSLYGLGRRAFVDACVFGTGATKFFIEGDTVKAERVIIEEIVVDDVEGRYEQPQQLFQEKLMHRAAVLDMFPDYEFQIKSVPSGVRAEDNIDSAADMISVVEAWHLPSGKDTKDGKKVICIENCTLDESEWNKNYFPFAFQRWNPKLLGFYGMGLAEELIGIQLELNKLLRVIQISQHLMAVPQVWLEYASKTVAKHVNNEVGGIKFYAGQPPIFMVPQAMSAEVYQHLENLWRKAFEISGVSQLSAGGKKPSGIDAAVALREMQDIESERFSLQQQRWEDYYMDATDISLDLLDDIYESGKDPAVWLKNSDKGFKMKWSDVRLPKDSYVVRPFPTALLPSTPAGKLQKVQEMLQAGFWDREEAMELLDFPDTKSVVSLKVAQRRDLKRMIEQIIDDGEYQPPEPFINLEMAKPLAQSYYLMSRSEGMPEARLELLRRFMDDVQAMIDAAMPPPAPPMAAPGLTSPDPMAALGVPAQPPVSDLMPIQGQPQPGGMPV